MPTIKGISLADLERYRGNATIEYGPTVAAPAPESPKRSKYGAQKTEVLGITFASKKEARRYLELRALEASGQISGLELQPEYTLNAEGGGKVCVYKGDFRYVEAGQIVIEDVKGFKTREYRLKKRFMKEQYGIEIRES